MCRSDGGPLPPAYELSTMPKLPVYLRPLSITALKEPLPVNVSHDPGDVALMFLGDLVQDRTNPLNVMRQRYCDVTNETGEPFVVPRHDAIMRHVVRPLIEAKQCYVLGMPVACIAQAGLVGEMVALWRFRMLQPHLDGPPRDEELQKLLRGREFDKLGQEERVRILRAFDPMDNETVQAFGGLRSLRRDYLHFMIEKKRRDVDKDARLALRHANMLVTKTLNVSFDEGMIVLPPDVMRYIQDIVSDQTATQDEGQ
jgi:hypothetical protein